MVHAFHLRGKGHPRTAKVYIVNSRAVITFSETFSEKKVEGGGRRKEELENFEESQMITIPLTID